MLEPTTASKHLYCKRTFSVVCANFINFTPKQYRVDLLFTLLFRTFSIVLDFPRFYSDLYHLKEIFKKNTFPIKLIDSCITIFSYKRLTEKPVILTAEKYDLDKALPLLGKVSLDLRTCLKNSIYEMRYCLCSIVVYNVSHGGSNATYSGKTCRRLKSPTSTAVKGLYFSVSIEDFKIFANNDSDFHIKVKQSILIPCDEPISNKNETSLPLSYLIDPSHMKLYYNDIYYCYCINITVVI